MCACCMCVLLAGQPEPWAVRNAFGGWWRVGGHAVTMVVMLPRAVACVLLMAQRLPSGWEASHTSCLGVAGGAFAIRVGLC